ncbi:YigZ family protein [Halarcobacter bivalviorum]|uniref:YigZ family protein n=1 Tax=Halarcobacter bivalviorum TaxID=663364 RepID=UPI00100A4DEE|nr:YigZ family protein [Halarcobacter bivalviorum]RXK07131.1 YigZ family protein [Halarcobacter bivalviorum]
MYFVKEETSSTYEEKKSKFIAYLTPYNQFDSLMKKLREEHPKARHFVYAYRYLNEFNQIVENSSDDGEPRGTSGKPSLNVLAGNELINSAVIIIRYFGGIKLGTGGLVRAYSDAVNLVINNSELIKYEDKQKVTLKVDYSRLSKIEYILNELEIEVSNKEFQNEVTLFLLVTKEQKLELENQLPIDLQLNN